MLTTVVHVEKHHLFYTIGLPVSETLSDIGVPSVFRFIDSDLTNKYDPRVAQASCSRSVFVTPGVT